MSLFPLTTSRLFLRDYTTEDWERVHIYGSDPEFSRYEAWGPNTVENTQGFVAEMMTQAQESPRYKYDFAICLRDSGLLIGGSGIRRESESSTIANLGWAISPEHQNQGYATEAARALIQFGFDELKLSVIYATCDSRNSASAKVMEKLEMKNVGLLVGDRLQKGELRNSSI